MPTKTLSPDRPAAARANEDWLKRYATVITMATFPVVGVTGILLMFHVGNGYLKSAHEWLGVAFVVASVLHVVRNSTAFLNLMARPRTHVTLLATLAVTAVFVAAALLDPTPRGDGRGRRHAEAAPVAELAATPVVAPEVRIP